MANEKNRKIMRLQYEEGGNTAKSKKSVYYLLNKG
jgi:hypothetical protein